MDIYFLFWVIIQYYFIYFVCTSASTLVFGSAFIWPPVYYDIPLPIIVVCLSAYLPSSLCSTMIYGKFSDAVLESAISLRIPGSFCWTMVSGTKIWAIGVLVAAEVSLHLYRLIWQNKELYQYVCIQTCVYVCVCIYIYICVCVCVCACINISVYNQLYL